MLTNRFKYAKIKKEILFCHSHMRIDYQKICLEILDILPQRQREVILRRFGLQTGQRETLEKIGNDFGITRERVRQIEESAIKALEKPKKENRSLQNIFGFFEDYFRQHGGLKREDIVLSSLGGEEFKNHLYFLLTLGDNFHRFKETDHHYPFWAIEKNILERVLSTIEHLVQIFEKEKTLLPEEKILKKVNQKKIFFHPSVIEVAKKIDKSPLGHLGLVDWPEVRPRGVADRAYLALKMKGKPMHFREIAETASEIEGSGFSKKRVLPQTVHNELIKDSRFVLVGRGIYALREWGYKPGVVKEVIADVLRQAQEPLTKEEILKRVLKQRQVKPNTVFLNLHDKTMFKKDREGRYTLVKK